MVGASLSIIRISKVNRQITLVVVLGWEVGDLLQSLVYLKRVGGLS